MKLTFGFVVVLFVAFSILSQQGVAQDVRPSEVAYRQWLERRATAGKADLSDSHLGIGFSVVRYKQVGVLVDLSLAAGQDLSELPALVFSVQPLSVEKPQDGKPILTEVGNSSSIASPKQLLSTKSSLGIFSQPELIARVPSTASAVRIDVSGFDSTGKSFSVYLPIRDTPMTAVLAKAAKCSNTNNLNDCQWFTGSCGPGGMDCPQGMLCVSCNNNSPSLNCVACTMGCGSGQSGSNCTPDVEAPQGCPES